MPYTAEISRTNPTSLLFLIDHSSSMDGSFAGQPGKKKADGVADAINRLLQNLVLKCAKSTGVRDYFHVGVIGYGAEVKPVLVGTSPARPLLPISVVANAPLRVEKRTRTTDDGSGKLVERPYRFPVWFEPVANGKTPMNAALELAKDVVTGFLAMHPDCFPPLVLNLTDGQPTDANPLAVAQALKGLKSSDGNVLLLNAHLSSAPGAPIAFPNSEDGLPDVFSKLLFRMSSLLPTPMVQAALEEGYTLAGAARGFMFNADLVAVTRFLEIGTRVASSVR
ncbi:MAG TPA: hypothetical protein VKE40_08310 [Gemmataceae bacterium]|nr:hypothetical protein [Gemmataceae bacterium]